MYVAFKLVPSSTIALPLSVRLLNPCFRFKGMCLANPSLSPDDACAELQRLHDQVMRKSNKVWRELMHVRRASHDSSKSYSYAPGRHFPSVPQPFAVTGSTPLPVIPSRPCSNERSLDVDTIGLPRAFVE